MCRRKDIVFCTEGTDKKENHNKLIKLVAEMGEWEESELQVADEEIDVLGSFMCQCGESRFHCLIDWRLGFYLLIYLLVTCD